MTSVMNRTFHQIEQDRIDAERYRWLRSEDVATNPKFYGFWREFEAKLYREDRLDALVDEAMRYAVGVPPPQPGGDAP